MYVPEATRARKLARPPSAVRISNSLISTCTGLSAYVFMFAGQFVGRHPVDFLGGKRGRYLLNHASEACRPLLQLFK